MAAIESSSSKEPVRARSFRQVSLRTLLLLTAAVGVWIAHAKNRYDIDHFAQQIEAMQPMARELIVQDPTQISVVKQEERWYDQNDWKLYLPEGKYKLSLATRDITENKLTAPAKTVSLPAGTHHVVLEQKRHKAEGWKISVLVNEKEVLRLDEPADWDPGHGSSGGGQYSRCTELLPTEPVVLFRRRFTVKTPTGGYSAPTEPCNGLLLWIEPSDSETPE